MKKAFLFLSGIIALNSWAQNIESSKILVIEYDFYLNLKNSQIFESSLLIANDRQVFKWGNNKKEFIEEENSENDFVITMIDGDSIGSYNYYNPKSNQLISRVKWLSDKEYYVEEPRPKIHWQIDDEVKNIGGIECQKARGNFRGRFYTVWFSTDFPIDSGPWKLSGLPGLILEAKDSTGQVHFIYNKIYYEDPSHFPNYELDEKDKITILEYAEIQSSFGKVMMKKIMAKMPRGTTMGTVNAESIEIFDEQE